MEGIKTKCLICGKDMELDEDGEPRVCDEHWKCPSCGIDAHPLKSDGTGDDGVIIDEDQVVCYGCDAYWTFKGFERAIVKKNSMVKCSHCKGTGLVKKDEVTTAETPLAKKRRGGN